MSSCEILNQNRKYNELYRHTRYKYVVLVELVHNTNTAQWSCEKWTSKMCWTANQTKLLYFFFLIFTINLDSQERERWKEPCCFFVPVSYVNFVLEIKHPKSIFHFQQTRHSVSFNQPIFNQSKSIIVSVSLRSCRSVYYHEEQHEG